TNNGALISDPATTKFKNLTIGTTGFLKGGAGDVFSVSGDLVNHSTQNTLWHTEKATLAFTGSGSHAFDFVATDFGRQRSGYIDNFTLGDLSLAAGEVIDVANGGGAKPTALYVGLFDLTGHDLGELANIHSDFNIYYDAALAGNAYLGGLDYAL